MLTAEGAQVFAETVTVEIPEVYELVTIALAIADLEEFFPEGVPSDSFIDKSTPYYQDVEAHFGRFRDHPLIAEIRAVYPPMLEELNLVGLLAYRFQSLAYELNEQDELVLSNAYRPFSEAQPETPALASATLPFNMDDPATLGLLSDFAQQTDFRQFYAAQQDEYDHLTQLSSDLCNFAAARDWLVAQFPAAYGSHRFVLSSLSGGTHNVVPFGTADRAFIQIVMYVSAFKGTEETAADVSVSDRAAHCCTSFTEIDHGYVNPATDLYAEEVEQAMPDITLWNTDATLQTTYSTSYATFNEYMTWAVYSLYITETFPADAQEDPIQFKEAIMVDRRGFAKYREFNRELMRLYTERALR
jgi:hypothetical protein